MAGRSELAATKNYEERFYDLMYMGDEIYRWVKQLERRADSVTKTASKNKVFQAESHVAQKDLDAVLAAYKAALPELKRLQDMVKKYEKKSSTAKMAA